MVIVKFRGESSIGLSNTSVDLSLASGTIEELYEKLDIHKEILSQLIVIVNGKIFRGDNLLEEGDEVLFHLPVTGG